MLAGTPDPTPVLSRRNPGQSGMTIIELLAALAIASSLASLAIPKFHNITNSARTARAIGDLKAIQTTLDSRDSLPDNLALAGITLVDPWGNPYVYVKFPAGAPRVDRFGVVVNTSYDLYSTGEDELSALSFNAGVSFDDIVRANDGGFLGTAGRF